MRDKTNFSKNSTTLTWKSRSHVRILIYRTWPISSYTESMILHDKWRILQLYVESKTIRVVWCWSKSGNSYTVTGIPAVLVIQQLSARCDVPARLKATKQISNWHWHWFWRMTIHDCQLYLLRRWQLSVGIFWASHLCFIFFSQISFYVFSQFRGQQKTSRKWQIMGLSTEGIPVFIVFPLLLLKNKTVKGDLHYWPESKNKYLFWNHCLYLNSSQEWISPNFNKQLPSHGLWYE